MYAALMFLSLGAHPQHQVHPQHQLYHPGHQVYHAIQHEEVYYYLHALRTWATQARAQQQLMQSNGITNPNQVGYIPPTPMPKPRAIREGTYVGPKPKQSVPYDWYSEAQKDRHQR